MRMLFYCLIVTAFAAQAVAQDLREIQNYPSGTFLENGAWAEDGLLHVTDYFGRSIRIVSPLEGEVDMVQLEIHPVAIRRYGERWVVSAHRIPFTDPAFTSSQALLILGSDGSLEADIPLPEALFLNGLLVRGDTAYVADSLAGTVWAVDLPTQEISAALTDPMLQPDPDAAVFRPGANGIAARGEDILISNSSRGLLLAASDDWSELRTVAETGPIDDFAVLADGSVVFASHGDAVGRITVDGAVETLLATGCDGCTSVIGPDAGSNELIVLTTGKLLEGGTLPARIFAVEVPD